MEIPTGLVIAAAVYIAASAAVLVPLAVFALPALAIKRRPSRYFDDWNDALKAPWFFWHVGGLLFRVQELLGNYVLPAPQRVCDLAYGYFRSQVIFTVNELGIPDLLHKHGPMSGAQLAAATGAHREYLERVLRSASRMGLVSMTHPRGSSSSSSGSSSKALAPQAAGSPERRATRAAARQQQEQQQQQTVTATGSGKYRPGRFDLDGAVYGLTQLSAVLCSDHPNCVGAMVALFGDHYLPAAHLLEGVKGGRVPYELYAGGKTHWEHMTEVPELYNRFNKAMTQFNNLSPVEAVFMAYPRLGSARRVIDVGGGIGGFVGAALQRYPQLRGTLFDLPHVIKQAKAAWAAERAGEAGRVTFHSGSFFEAGAVPSAEGDDEIFVLREILHDWSDADSLRILRQVRAAIGPHTGCRLVIVEAVISEAMASSASARIGGDIHMMVQYGDAKERTEAQFAALLAGAGFEMGAVVPTKGLFMVVEARPV